MLDPPRERVKRFCGKIRLIDGMGFAMKISKQGLDLIKRFEGCELSAYQDSVGVWTIGYGHTVTARQGMRITQSEAGELLAEDIPRYEVGVLSMVKVKLSQGQFDALVSFAFNLGLGNLGRSTLLRKVNYGDPAGAALEFKRWTRAGGVVLNGLVRRREAERVLFVSG